LAKVPSPRSLPISYFPTRVRGVAISMYVVIQPLSVSVSVSVCVRLYPSVCLSFLSFSFLSLALSTSLSPSSGLRSLGELSLSHRFHMPALLLQHFETLVNRNSTDTSHPSNRPNRPQTGKHDETRNMREVKGPSIEVYYGN
jgi:hypothetical protein